MRKLVDDNKKGHVLDDIDFLNFDLSHSSDFQKIDYLTKILGNGSIRATSINPTSNPSHSAENIQWLLQVFQKFTAEDISLLTQQDIYDILTTKPNRRIITEKKGGGGGGGVLLKNSYVKNKKMDVCRCKSQAISLLSALQRVIERDEIIYGNSCSRTHTTTHANTTTHGNTTTTTTPNNNNNNNNNKSTNASANRRYSMMMMMMMNNTTATNQSRYEEQEYIRLKAEIPSFVSNKLNLSGKMTAPIDMAVCRGDFDHAYELLKNEIALLESHLQIGNSADKFKASDDLELFLTRLQQSQQAVEVDASEWWLRNILSQQASVITRVTATATHPSSSSINSQTGISTSMSNNNNSNNNSNSISGSNNNNSSSSSSNSGNNNNNASTDGSRGNDIGVKVDYYHTLYPFPLSDDDDDDDISENKDDDDDDEEELQYGTIGVTGATATTESSGTSGGYNMSSDTILTSARHTMLNINSSGSSNNNNSNNSSRSDGDNSSKNNNDISNNNSSKNNNKNNNNSSSSSSSNSSSTSRLNSSRTSIVPITTDRGMSSISNTASTGDSSISHHNKMSVFSPTHNRKRIPPPQSFSQPPRVSSRSNQSDDKTMTLSSQRNSNSGNNNITVTSGNSSGGAAAVKDTSLRPSVGNIHINNTINTVNAVNTDFMATQSTDAISSSSSSGQFDEIINNAKETIDRQMSKFIHQTHTRTNQLKETHFQDNSLHYQQIMVQKRDIFLQKMDQNMDVYVTKMNVNIKKAHDEQMNILTKARKDGYSMYYSTDGSTTG